MDYTNREAVVTNVSDGLGYINNDGKYTGKAKNQLVKLVYNLGNDFYITNFFIPEFINEKNDYIHYGFLIVSLGNVKLLEWR